MTKQQTSQRQLQEKKLHDLKVFALEYVKQVVAKASEISQERHEAREAQKLANFYIGTNCAKHHEKSLNLATDRLIKEAAVQINQQFRLPVSTVNVQKYSGNEAQDAFALARPAPPTAYKPGELAHEHRPHLLVQQRDGGAKTAGATTTAIPATSRSASAANKTSSRRRRLQQRLNWHLLVSCFSTCLPQTVVDSMPSSGAGGGSVTSAGSSSV